MYIRTQRALAVGVSEEYSIKRISHIGSTSIKNIYAKDIVDVLIEIDSNEDIEKTAQQIEKNGFYRMCTENQRISLNKGYTKKGFAKRVYHIHLRYIGDNDELYFRDYMNDHPDIAKDYEALKLSLWKKCMNIIGMFIQMRKHHLLRSGLQ